MCYLGEIMYEYNLACCWVGGSWLCSSSQDAVHARDMSWREPLDVWSEEQDSRGVGELDSFTRLVAKGLVVVENRVELIERYGNVSAEFLVVADGGDDPSL